MMNSRGYDKDQILQFLRITSSFVASLLLKMLF